jgi:dTDP-4-dehydrorhamnose reductase
MRTLLVGATGFLGSHLRGPLGCDAAGRSDIDLLAPAPSRWRKLVQGYDRVLICAAVADVETCARDPETTTAVNVTGTCALIDVVRDAGAIPVFFSTDYVFEDRFAPKVESDPRKPSTAYGRQKLAVERHLEDGPQPFLLLRTGKQVSHTLHRRNVLASMATRLVASETVPCFADQTFNPVFVEDIARLLHDHPDLTGVYHVAGPVQMTRYEMGRQLARALGCSETLIKPTHIADAGFSEPRPRDNTLDCSKIEKRTGFRFTDLEDGLAPLVADLQRGGLAP